MWPIVAFLMRAKHEKLYLFPRWENHKKRLISQMGVLRTQLYVEIPRL